ncbi:hypothetical protein BZG36_04250 [Bifiguratus adelaidae]|uniref:Uncharacterized protein n=1 Tax=Bifiguratus adelaidae TaxID=1938954 RepID=A0A261XVX1_9FUNG|nr:hypothetical protein BZG36_04250 [Bifiguratus adelaidae]
MKRSDNEIEYYLQWGVRALDRLSSFHPSFFPILRDFILRVKGPGVMSNMTASENNGTSTNGNYLHSTDTMSSLPNRPEQTPQRNPSSPWNHKTNDTFPTLSPMTYPFAQTSIAPRPNMLPTDSSMPNCFVAEPSQLFDQQPVNPMTSFPVLPEQNSIATPDSITLAYCMGLPSPFRQIDGNGADCDSYF